MDPNQWDYSLTHPQHRHAVISFSTSNPFYLFFSFFQITLTCAKFKMRERRQAIQAKEAANVAKAAAAERRS